MTKNSQEQQSVGGFSSPGREIESVVVDGTKLTVTLEPSTAGPYAYTESAKAAPAANWSKVRPTISPLEVDKVPDIMAAGVTAIEVRERTDDDTFLVAEHYTLANGNEEWTQSAYRTADRLDLATRLQLDPTYDPADLVGRVFLVGA